MGRVRLRVGLLLATAVVASLTVFVLRPTSVVPQPGKVTETAAATCPADLLIAVAGGGESGKIYPSRVGPTAGLFVNAYRAEQARAGESVQLKVINFASANAAVLRPRAHPYKAASKYVTKAMDKKWRSGVAAAANRTTSAIIAAAHACPQQNIVLVGYSQGAMAVHRSLLQVKVHPSVTARVTGVMLISDGNRTKGTTAAIAGTPRAPRSARGLDDTRVAHFADVPFGPLKGKVFSMCRKGDVVCNYGPTAAATGIKISRSYRTGTNATKIRSLAAGMAVRSQRIPRISTTPVVISTKVNTRVAKQLTATVHPTDRSRLSWASTSGVPPGMTLSPHGLLQGVPSVPGTWTLRYTVRNTSNSLYARPVPGAVRISVAGSNAAALSAGGQDSCEVRTNGTLYCWGLNTWGQVGDRTKTNRPDPTRMGVGVTWATVSTSGSHTCGINRAGSLYCWGLNNYGQLGDGTKTTNVNARTVTAGSEKWLSVTTSWFQTCALSTTHHLYCWGLNNEGQLGDGTKTTRLRPTAVGSSALWSTVTSGGWSTCATKTTGTLWCWGANDFGQVGDGTTTARLKPVQVGTARTWARAAAGWLHTCGYTATGFELCWGYNQNGEVGDGSATSRLSPVNVGFAGPWVDVSVGDGFSCGVRNDGTSLCWGDNATGQLGTGDRTARRTPTQVSSGDGWTQVVNGFSHSCGITRTGGTKCWGINDAGQIGDGTGTTRLAPVPISGD